MGTLARLENQIMAYGWGKKVSCFWGGFSHGIVAYLLLGRQKSDNGKITQCPERLAFISINMRWRAYKALAFLYSQWREMNIQRNIQAT